jgi:alpha-amylase/alpha-mannosidase (GH57 family)
MLAFSIHGHFYQPPREDPLTGVIPSEEGAAPYPNWNERIHAECYRPNATLGNYEHISFNFGPTLLSWMQNHDPATYRQIIAQDHANVRKYRVGNAIAQAYNHTILPLASYRDKVTQVMWGIADFENRFGRKPQGMWLPETAVNLETLSVLAEHGIKFTILAPWQAEETLDFTQPYRVMLGGGLSITVFFYHQQLSGDISFHPESTADAYRFVNSKLITAFGLAQASQLVLVASDGELYGHHQRFREKFLSQLLDGASSNAGLTPTFPARWLQEHPPVNSISIREDTSWSCHHGVSRWHEECPCAYDGRWKVHLRRAIDRLAEKLDQVYFRHVGAYIADPWELRHAYGPVLTGEQTADDLIHSYARRKLPAPVTRQVAALLRAQYERQRMYTSCGWFFEDFNRIEPKNNLAYAAQAVALTQQATGIDLSKNTIDDFKHVVSPSSGLRGDEVFGAHLERLDHEKTRSRFPADR